MRQLFLGAYTFTATMGALIMAAHKEPAFALVLLACAGVGAVALTKGEQC